MPYYPPLPGDGTATGPAGPQGDSAYQVALAEGFVGTEAEWLASLVGPAGDERLVMVPDQSVAANTAFYALGNNWYHPTGATAPNPITRSSLVSAGFITDVVFKSVSGLLSSTVTDFIETEIIKAGVYLYSVAASDAVDHHLTTAGGVKIYYVPEDGSAYVEAVGTNQAAAQKVIDAFPWHEVHMPPNVTITLTSSLEVNNGTKVIGNGCNITCADGQFFNAVLSDNKSFIEVSGLKIHGPAGGSGFDIGIYLKNTKNFVVKNNEIKNIGFEDFAPTDPPVAAEYAAAEKGWGIFISGEAPASAVNSSNGCIHGTVENNVIEDVKGRGFYRGDGIYVSQSKDITIKGNTVTRSRRQGIAVTSYASNIRILNNNIFDTYLAAIDLEPNAANTTENIQVKGNTVVGYALKPAGYIGNQYFGIDLHSQIFGKVTVNDNYIEATTSQAQECIRAQNMSYDAIITNNRLYCGGYAEQGMLLNSGGGFKDLTITGNRIYGFTLRGIEGFDTGKTICSENYCETDQATISDGIKLTECETLTLTSNQIVAPNSTWTDSVLEFRAIQVRNGDNVVVSNNTAKINAGRGIDIYYNATTNGVVSITGNVMTAATATSGLSAYRIYTAGVGAVVDLGVAANSSDGFAEKGQSSGSVPSTLLSAPFTKFQSLNFGFVQLNEERTTTITVTGVKLINAQKTEIHVIIPGSSVPVGFNVYRAYVSADDTVTLCFTISAGGNETVGTIPIGVVAREYG